MQPAKASESAGRGRTAAPRRYSTSSRNLPEFAARGQQASEQGDFEKTGRTETFPCPPHNNYMPGGAARSGLLSHPAFRGASLQCLIGSAARCDAVAPKESQPILIGRRPLCRGAPATSRVTGTLASRMDDSIRFGLMRVPHTSHLILPFFGPVWPQTHSNSFGFVSGDQKHQVSIARDKNAAFRRVFLVLKLKCLSPRQNRSVSSRFPCGGARAANT